MTKVRHLTTVHVIGDTRVFHKECKGLQAAGYDIALIACHPRDEVVDGVRIIGLGAARNRFDRMTLKTLRCFRSALKERADIYHFHDPELIPVGLALRALGKKVVYDVHEDVPEQILNKFWIWPPAKRLFSLAARGFEALAGRALSGIVTATPSISKKFPAAKTVTVQNFPEASLAVPDPAEKPFAERGNAFVYVGGLSEQQGLLQMVEAFDRLPAGLTGVMAGNFKQLRDRVERMPGWARVRYPGTLGRSEVVASIRGSVCGIVVDHPITNYVEAYSTKMFEYLACGIPVICSDFPLWQRIVTENDCGIVVDPFDVAAVAKAITDLNADAGLAARLGANGRRAVAERFNWDVEFSKLLDLYERIS